MVERDTVWPLGELIRAGRQALGLGVRRAATRAGIAPTTWTSIETGTRIKKGGGEPEPADLSKPSVVVAALVVGVDYQLALQLAGLEPLSDPEQQAPAVEPEPSGWLELKVIRERDGWTRADLAEAAGLHPETLRLYENGQRNPTLAAVKKLADVLRVPYSVLEPSPRGVEAPAVAVAPPRSAAHMSPRQPGRSRARMTHTGQDKEAATPGKIPESRRAESRT
jgi:transcriptional regulator with XRE-family HTH domain